MVKESKVVWSRRGVRATVALAATGVLILTGCSTTGGGNGTDDTKDGTFSIGHSFADLQNPFYASMRPGLEAGFAADGFEYQATDSRQDASTQLNDVENMVQKGVDLLIIDPVDETAIVPGIEAANAAGIPILMLVKKPEGGSWDARIFVDQNAIGYTGCEYLASLLGANKKVIQLQGIMAVSGYRERAEGCEDALNKAGVEIIAQQEGNGERTKSMDVMEALLKVHPDVAGVFGNNDEEALGALEALKANGFSPADVMVVGVDGTELGLKSMCEGELKGTVGTLAGAYVDLIIKTVNDIKAGTLSDTDVKFNELLVTPKNLVETINIEGHAFANDCPAAQ